MANHKHFRRGTGVFTCACCGRKTRTTYQPDYTDFCFECWELAGHENMLSDNGEEEYIAHGYLKERDELLADAVKRGGNEQAIRDEYSDIFAIKS